MNKIKTIKKVKSKQNISPKVEKTPSNKKISKADEQLAAIRNLLFGEQLLRIEQTIQQQNEIMNKRLDSIETLISNKSEEFDKKLVATNHDFSEHIKSSHLEHINQENILDKKLATLDKNLGDFQSTTEKDFSQAQDTLTHTAKEINVSLNREVKRLTQKIQATAEELSAKKADRNAIANLLESMASNLSQKQA